MQLDEKKHGGDNIRVYVQGPGKKRKEFWNGFKSYRDKNNKMRAECIYCLKTYAAESSTNGTSGLSKHWKACVENPANKSKGKQAKLVLNKIEESPQVPNENKIKDALIKMIIIDGLPFGCVEKSGMMAFVRYVNPTFQLPSPETVASDCYDLFLEEKVKLVEFLKNSCRRVCLTTEGWTSLDTLDYMSITAHFIDNDWLLQKRVLNLCQMESYSGDDISAGIKACCRQWGLCDKVFSITVGNSSSNDVACAHLRQMVIENGTCINLGKNLQVECIAQSSNLIVWDVLKEYSTHVDKVRSFIEYVRESSERLIAFKEEADKLEINCETPFCLDDRITWNSTYKMLEGALIYKDAFPQLDVPRDVNGSYVGYITSEEWSRIEMLVKFLKEFYRLTKHASNFSNVTINTTIFQIGHIVKLLNQWVEISDPVCRTMALHMKKKCDEHWGDLEKMNMLVFVAVILDPAYKYLGLQFGLCRLFGKEAGDSLATRVKQFAYELFDEYRNIYASSSSQSQPDQSDTPALVDNGLWPDFVNDVNEQLKIQPNELDPDELVKTELDCFLNEQNAKEVTDVLTWWKLNRLRFPVLAHMARDVLAIPVSSITSESVFSSEERTFDEFRSSLTPEALEGLACTRDWLREELDQSESDEEFSLEEIVEMERGGA